MSRHRFILFIEETAGEGYRYVAQLAAAGFETIVAKTDGEALDVVHRERMPSAIVIERNTHDWLLTRAIRSESRALGIPIVALGTDSAVPVDASCDRFLPKPCSPDELAVAIETLVIPESRQTTRPTEG